VVQLLIRISTSVPWRLDIEVRIMFRAGDMVMALRF